jgi:hypothetical protein
VDDVAVVVVDKVGNGRYQPLLIAAGEEQDGGNDFVVHLELGEAIIAAPLRAVSEGRYETPA